MNKIEAYYAAMEAVLKSDFELADKISVLEVLMDDWKMAKLLDNQQETE